MIIQQMPVRLTCRNKFKPTLEHQVLITLISYLTVNDITPRIEYKPIHDLQTFGKCCSL